MGPVWAIFTSEPAKWGLSKTKGGPQLSSSCPIMFLDLFSFLYPVGNENLLAEE